MRSSGPKHGQASEGRRLNRLDSGKGWRRPGLRPDRFLVRWGIFEVRRINADSAGGDRNGNWDAASGRKIGSSSINSTISVGLSD